MKPSTIANASLLLTILFLILFSIPYAGFFIMLACIIFFGSTHAGKIAKMYLLFLIIFAVIIFVLGFIEGWTDYQFPFLQGDELEALVNLPLIA